MSQTRQISRPLDLGEYKCIYFQQLTIGIQRALYQAASNGGCDDPTYRCCGGSFAISDRYGSQIDRGTAIDGAVRRLRGTPIRDGPGGKRRTRGHLLREPWSEDTHRSILHRVDFWHHD